MTGVKQDHQLASVRRWVQRWPTTSIERMLDLVGADGPYSRLATSILSDELDRRRRPIDLAAARAVRATVAEP
jgi:hypothetical protein